MTIFLSLSGGMDSTALLALARVQASLDETAVVPVAFNYGQRHVRELESAQAVADFYGLDLVTMQLPTLSSPALTNGGPVPHGHYAADTMVATVVQGRNLLFASTLVSLAAQGDEVWLGVHAGDHAIYPDCRRSFIDPLEEAILAAYGVELVAPFVGMSKADIAAEGTRLGAPFASTWSCYEGGKVHCGRCGTCVERAEAFHVAGVSDPTEYADNEFWREAVEEAGH